MVLWWYFILCIPWNIWNWLIYQLSKEGAVFQKRRKMQMTTKYVFTMKNGEHVVYFLNIINLLSFQVWSRPMTSFKKRKCIHEKKMPSLSLYCWEQWFNGGYGQRPNCRLKINIIIIEDMIGRLTNYRHLGTVHKHLLWGTRCKKVGLNICDLHKRTLKKITNFAVKIEFTWFYGARLTHRLHGKKCRPIKFWSVSTIDKI